MVALLHKMLSSIGNNGQVMAKQNLIKPAFHPFFVYPCILLEHDNFIAVTLLSYKRNKNNTALCVHAKVCTLRFRRAFNQFKYSRVPSGRSYFASS